MISPPEPCFLSPPWVSVSCWDSPRAGNPVEVGCRHRWATRADVGSGLQDFSRIVQHIKSNRACSPGGPPSIWHAASELARLLLLRRDVAKGMGAGRSVWLQSKSPAVQVMSFRLLFVTLNLCSYNSRGSQGLSSYSTLYFALKSLDCGFWGGSSCDLRCPSARCCGNS